MIRPITGQMPQVRFGERVRTKMTDQDFQTLKTTAAAASVAGTATAGTLAAGIAEAGAIAAPALTTFSVPAGATLGTNLATGTAGSATQLAGTGLMATGPQSGFTAFLFRVLDQIGLDKFADWLAEQPIVGGASLIAVGSTVNSIGSGGGGAGTGLTTPV